MKNLRHVLALMLAVAMIVSIAPAGQASAAITGKAAERIEEAGKTAYFNAKTDVDHPSKVYGVQITLICKDLSQGLGGSVVINAEGNNWDQKEWGNAGSGKEFTMVATSNKDEFTITRLEKKPMFTDTESYSNIAVQQWWGSDFEITKITYLDANGKAIVAEPVKEEIKKEEPKVEEPKKEEVKVEEPKKVELKDQVITLTSAKSKSLKASDLKKKAKSFTLTSTVEGDAKLTYKLVSSPTDQIKVSKAGKVTVAKGVKKGSYKIKVEVKAAATAEYKEATKNVTVTVKVK